MVLYSGGVADPGEFRKGEHGEKYYKKYGEK
jgi:hypothetical protein